MEEPRIQNLEHEIADGKLILRVLGTKHPLLLPHEEFVQHA